MYYIEIELFKICRLFLLFGTNGLRTLEMSIVLSELLNLDLKPNCLFYLVHISANTALLIRS